MRMKKVSLFSDVNISFDPRITTLSEIVPNKEECNTTTFVSQIDKKKGNIHISCDTLNSNDLISLSDISLKFKGESVA